jgi:two-component sensor histidine kinase
MSLASEWNLKRINFLIATNRVGNIYVSILDLATNLILLGRKKESLDMVLDKCKTITPSSNYEKRTQLMALASCYYAVNNFPMVRKYCQELIDLNELRIQRKEIVRDMVADQYLTNFYLAISEYDKAEKYFVRATHDWPKDNPNRAHEGWRSYIRFKLDSVKGDFLSAIKQLQISRLINDSVYTESKSKQIEELKITYETEQKDKDIKLLRQNELIQKSKMERQAIIRNISFAIGTLLIIIVGLLYNRYRLKQRTNSKLELQQQEITQQNSSLQHLLNEKEWLVKEIHHRVKNNLQIVMSLLNSQSAYIDNEPALSAIHDSQHRVHAMSLIHQKLYGSENLSSINMAVYIRELVSYLADSFSTGQRIRFEIDVEPLEIDVSQAVPLGLILNEAITNSIKYAFPNGREGLISISLAETEPHRYLLSISDNGIGMPTNGQSKKQSSLGMSLMAGLSEDLNGNFYIDSYNGTKIEVSFTHDRDTKRNESLTA